MTDAELQNALDGLYAYDTGSHDSGIHDEALRQRCKEAIAAMPLDRYEIVPKQLSRMVRQMWLTDEAIEQGYGLETAYKFIMWLRDKMEVPL